MTDLTAALLEVTLEVCLSDLEERTGAPALTRLLVVGMGRLGGGEQGYGSDADVVFVHDPVEGADEAAAQTQALEVVKELIRLLGLRGPDPNLDVDASLRPEGKSGPLVRSLESYRQYYEPLVAGLGGAGPAPGRAGRRRPRARRALPRAHRADPLARGRSRRRPGARDPHPQGPDGGRAAATRRRPQDALQARPRWPVRRRVGRAARAAPARPRAPRAAHHLDDGRAGGRRAARAWSGRARRRPRRRVAARLVDAQRRRAVPGQGARCRAHRPARRRRHRPHPRACPAARGRSSPSATGGSPAGPAPRTRPSSTTPDPTPT